MWFFKSNPSITASDVAHKVREEGVTLIDVRTPAEYKTGHALGAKNFPLNELNEANAEHLASFREVYVICQSGGRSSAAVSKLRATGVNAIDVKGGTTAWESSHLPMG